MDRLLEHTERSFSVQEGHRYIKANGAVTGKIIVTDSPLVRDEGEYKYFDPETWQYYTEDGRFLSSWDSDRDLICKVNDDIFFAFLKIAKAQQMGEDWAKDFADFLRHSYPAEADEIYDELDYYKNISRARENTTEKEKR